MSRLRVKSKVWDGYDVYALKELAARACWRGHLRVPLIEIAGGADVKPMGHTLHTYHRHWPTFARQLQANALPQNVQRRSKST